MLTPGIYRSKIINCGMKKAKTGSDMVFVTFETTDENGEFKEISWFGSLSGGATPITLDNLLDLGFNNDWDNLTSGAEITCLNREKEWDIVVENETYNGKTFTKVKYINDPDKPRGMERMESSEAVSTVKSMNLKALTIQRQKERSAGKPKIQAKATAQTKPAEDDIAF